MKNRAMASSMIVVVGLILATSGSAQASIFTVTNPASFAAISGTDPAIASNVQAKIGAGSWQANGASKSSLGFTPASLGFSSAITISDIDSMSFSTYKSTTGGSVPDWYLSVYTAPTGNAGSDNGGSWYGLRMTWEGLYANNFSNPADQWNTFSTDSGANQLTMLDSNTTNYGFYGAPTLADIQAEDGVVNWATYSNSSSSETFDYNESKIISFVLETGSDWASGFDGYLDEFKVTVGGVTAIVDFEGTAVPEPASLVIWGLLGAGCAGAAVRRRRKRGATGTPWTEGNRQAIHQIVGGGRLGS